MNIYKIIYLDHYGDERTAELPAPDEETAVENLRELLAENVEVLTVEEVDE